MPVSPYVELTKCEIRRLNSLVYTTLQQGFEHQRLTLPQAPRSTGLQQIVACFVTIYVDGQLRGCTGSNIATNPLWQEVCEHAFASAFEDSRFSPLQQDELASLKFTISLLSPMRQLPNLGESQLCRQLRPNQDGLMLSQQARKALFLPAVWASISSPKQFVSALKRKGGWPEAFWSSDIDVFVFSLQAQLSSDETELTQSYNCDTRPDKLER